MIGAHLAAINQNSLISYNTCPDIAIHALHRIAYVYYVILLINNFTGIYISVIYCVALHIDIPQRPEGFH